MTFSYRHLLFAAICLIWGSTWAATKLGVDAVPPMFFAGTRFVAAGIMLLAWHWAPRHRRGQGVPARDLPRLALATLFLIPLAYAPLYWALRVVPSGLAAVLNSALTPLTLLLLGIAGGEERWSNRQGIAIATGILGLFLLFWHAAGGVGRLEPLQALGAAAVIFSTFASCAGSVLARPLLARHPTALLSGLCDLAGGAALVIAALAVEPGVFDTPAWGIAAWSGWLYLVLFGTLIGYSFYFVLLRDWGPSRAGTYAFICPIIAVIIGVLAFGEAVSFTEAAGMLLMLSGAALALGIGPRAAGGRPARRVSG